MSWCSTSRGGPPPARATCIATPAIGTVSVIQLPAVVLTVVKAPPRHPGSRPRATSAQTTRFWRGLARQSALPAVAGQGAPPAEALLLAVVMATMLYFVGWDEDVALGFACSTPGDEDGRYEVLWTICEGGGGGHADVV